MKFASTRGTALCYMLACFSLVTAEPIRAIHKQGSMHGFLLLKSLQGEVLGVGEQVNVSEGTRIRSRLTFRFRDGSIDDETTVFQQESVLQLISDHHIQKGPSFPQPLDLAVNVAKGDVTWRENKNGKEEVKTEHMDLPRDLANGIMGAVLVNTSKSSPETKVSYLSVATKPRVIQLSIKPDGSDNFHVGRSTHEARRLRIHIELGGITGMIAPTIGKKPSDIKVWVMDGEVPTFLRMEGALYLQGPTWVTELAIPVWSLAGR